MKNLDYFFDDLPDLMPEISDYLDNYNLCDAVVMSDELRVRALLDRGESPNQTNSHGTTALELAVENWDPEIITLLIKAGVNLMQNLDLVQRYSIWRLVSLVQIFVNYFCQKVWILMRKLAMGIP